MPLAEHLWKFDQYLNRRHGCTFSRMFDFTDRPDIALALRYPVVQYTGMKDSVEPWAIQLRKGLAELIVLHVLAKGETYGYELMQTLSADPHTALGESSVYPLFSRLAEAGMIAVRMVPSDTGPPRRYYRLTRDGIERRKQLDHYWYGVVHAIDALKGKP
jgi:PadR family transcriptional regulator, regulatory protein PadR